MVTADCDAATLLHCAVRVQNIVCRPSADIDHQRSEVFLVLGKDHLSRSQPAKNDILNVQRQFLHAPDRVLNARPHTVNNVEVCFQSLAEHPHWVKHAVLSVDMIMLNDGMKECVLRRYAYLTSIDFYVFDILFVNFIAVLGQHDAPSIVEALKV